MYLLSFGTYIPLSLPLSRDLGRFDRGATPRAPKHGAAPARVGEFFGASKFCFNFPVSISTPLAQGKNQNFGYVPKMYCYKYYFNSLIK